LRYWRQSGSSQHCVEDYESRVTEPLLPLEALAMRGWAVCFRDHLADQKSSHGGIHLVAEFDHSCFAVDGKACQSAKVQVLLACVHDIGRAIWRAPVDNRRTK
jgi:hypothetical protein